MNETESKNYWMQIFDELKSRGVQDIFFMSMHGVFGLEEGAKSIFPKVIVQRCIVHLVRSSFRYVPYKNYKDFSRKMKNFYGAPSLKACQSVFDAFQNVGLSILVLWMFGKEIFLMSSSFMIMEARYVKLCT